MQSIPYITLFFSAFISTVSHTVALPQITPSPSGARKQAPLPVEIIHEFPQGTWLENLAVRSCGQVLVSVLSTPDLYQIDPSNETSPILVHSFPEHLGLLGITETTRDIFYLAAGNYSVFSKKNVPGAWNIYEVDLTKGPRKAKVAQISNFPDFVLLNGLVTLDASKGLILLGDAGAGAVYRYNVKTNEVKIVIKDPTMNPVPPSPVGINGIKIRKGSLFFTNAGQKIFVKVPINPDGTASGPIETLSTNSLGDDFALDGKGDAFLAQNGANNLGYLGSEGAKNITVLAGAPLQDKHVLAGPSSCQFGRLRSDKKALYITTTGGISSNATAPGLGGTLSKVDLQGSRYYNNGWR
ncbi:MAG: hypothetical protein Q9191_006212 [Dirinaria sp. TL-2023a]